MLLPKKGEWLALRQFVFTTPHVPEQVHSDLRGSQDTVRHCREAGLGFGRA
jgi:hypothetical protein